MQHLLSSKFKLGADASGAAGPVGRDAGADTNWKMQFGGFDQLPSPGHFAGIDLNGAAITQDKDGTMILYGRMIPFSNILEGKAQPPASSAPFLTAVAKYATQAHDRHVNKAGI
jgi:SH3 domain-containing YSC84-like protein 1